MNKSISYKAKPVPQLGVFIGLHNMQEIQKHVSCGNYKLERAHVVMVMYTIWAHDVDSMYQSMSISCPFN